MHAHTSVLCSCTCSQKERETARTALWANIWSRKVKGPLNLFFTFHDKPAWTKAFSKAWRRSAHLSTSSCWGEE